MIQLTIVNLQARRQKVLRVNPLDQAEEGHEAKDPKDQVVLEFALVLGIVKVNLVALGRREEGRHAVRDRVGRHEGRSRGSIRGHGGAKNEAGTGMKKSGHEGKAFEGCR